MKLARLPSLFALALPFGCSGADAETAGDTAASAGTSEGEGEASEGGEAGEASGGTSASSDATGSTSTTSTSSSTSSSETTSTSSSGEGGDAPPPARGIQIVDVTIDQAIRIPIALERTLVGPNDRNQVVIGARPGMLRAFYRVEPGFVERNLYAELTLHHADGSTTVISDYTAVRDQACGAEAPHECGYESFIDSFNFMIPAEHMAAGVEYEIALMEATPGHENDPSTSNPRFPDAGTLPIGVEDRYMKIRVVVVPFRHAVRQDCPPAPDITAAITASGTRTWVDLFEEKMLAFNPAEEVEIIAHAPVDFDGDVSESGPLMSFIRQLRSSDAAPPEYYYYGLISVCENAPDFSGVAQFGGPSKDEAMDRVGWGVFRSAETSDWGTLIHEVGHEQGRRHVACNGEEGGPDESYPDHPMGRSVTWGIDVIGTPEIHDPEDREYMSYCGDNWVSEWGWSLVFPTIATLSSWELEDDGQRPRRLLFGDVSSQGDVSWWIGDEYFTPPTTDTGHSIRFEVAGAVVDAPARMIPFERSSAYTVVAELPPGAELGVATATWTGGGRRVETDLRRVARR